MKWNWKAFFTAIGHAAIGGAAAGVATVGSGASFKTTGWAALASAVTSILSLFAKPPAAQN